MDVDETPKSRSHGKKRNGWNSSEKNISINPKNSSNNNFFKKTFDGV